MKKTINPALVYLETLAPSGRRSMKSQLRSALKILRSRRSIDTYNWGSLCYADMIKIRSQLLEQKRSIHTVNLCLAGLKGTAQCAFHLGILKAEDLMHIKSVKRAPGRSEPTGRSLSSKELKILFRYCQKDKSITGIRDSALLAVMVTTGLRRAEVVLLELSDYNCKTRQLIARKTKGNKDRVCQLPTVTSILLDKWISKRTKEGGPIFCRIRKNNKIELKQLTAQAVYNIVRSKSEKANLGLVRPHDLRRSFVTVFSLT
ncbi:MAG: tyrosine-type recombinase/integrase [Gammaproteobacteria bacterium]|nr:tyrosine-type recombinase/integrase [Gammaproteobacteria bacterium]